MRVAVLTTSYPRTPEDVAGRFVADAVTHVREAGIEIDVVSPTGFHHFGIAYGHGIVANLRREPWRALLLPAMLASFRRAARRAARTADLVHAHWLPSAAVVLPADTPLVVQLWGTDVELAHRLPRLARAVLRRACAVVCASSELAERAEALGARDVHVIPTGVVLPAAVGAEAEPPEILYAGRLSREKGILELVEAAAGLNLVVAGDGPLRDRVPAALGFVPHGELERLYGRAAIVACPSHREGFGVACAEAMAHGRAVVATPVGGHRDLIADGETGLLVPPGDVDALRAALRRLLADEELRRRLGAAARERVRVQLAWEAIAEQTVGVYRSCVSGERAAGRASLAPSPRSDRSR